MHRAWKACVILMAWLAAGAGPATQPITHVRVTEVVTDRFPALTDTQSEKVLRTAEEMMQHGYGLAVQFDQPVRRDAADYFGEIHKRIDPYKVPSYASFNPFSDPHDVVYPAALLAVQRADDLPHLHRFLGVTAPFATEEAAAHELTDHYWRRFDKLTSLRGSDGQLRVTQDHFEDFSLSWWSVFLFSPGPKKEYDLILWNGLLMEDAKEWASFHSLTSALANGCAFPVANNCAVACGQILCGDPDIRADHLGNLSADEQITLIAYVVAHEVGTHLLMLRDDDYTPTAGLARPLLVLKDKSEVLDYTSWKFPTATARPLDNTFFQATIAEMRLRIALARHDDNAVNDEVLTIHNLHVNPKWKQWMLDLAKQATQ